MRNHLTRVVVPVVGLLAVTTALALVGIAPILLFPASKDAGPHSVAPSASSEVATVAAAGHANGGSRPTGAGESTGGFGAAGSGGATSLTGPNPTEGGGTISGDEPPIVDQPDKVARQGDGPADDEDMGDQGKQKTKKGKALGHSKDKAKGKAKGHEKWQGQAPVAFPPHAAKPGHEHPASAPEHSGRGHRPHARARS